MAKVVHVRTLTVFISVFFAVIQLTVVASLHRADVFRVRLGGHCRDFGVKPCSNVAHFSIGEVRARFETQVSANSYYIFEQSRNF